MIPDILTIVSKPQSNNVPAEKCTLKQIIINDNVKYKKVQCKLKTNKKNIKTN